MDDLLDLVEECETGEGLRMDVEIVAQMQNEMEGPIEIDEDEDKDNPPPRLTTA